MIQKLRRIIAEWRLALVDAEVARWYVYDGQLSARPLNGKLSEHGAELRRRRRERVRELERAGGRDPWPTIFQIPTDDQRVLHDITQVAKAP